MEYAYSYFVRKIKSDYKISWRGSKLVLTSRTKLSLKSQQQILERNSTWIEAHRPVQKPFPESISVFGVKHRFEANSEQKKALLIEPDEFLVTINPDLDWRGKFRQKVKKTISERANQLAINTNLTPISLRVTDTKSRWGSCSTTKTVSLSWRLALVPLFVSDYVIIHELCHLQEMNHGDNFWNLVAKYCPNYRSAKDWLAKHATEILNL